MALSRCIKAGVEFCVSKITPYQFDDDVIPRLPERHNPGLERTSPHAVAGIAAFLGIAQPSGD